jgi:internalin A
MKKPKIIKQLEQQTNTELIPLDIGNIIGLTNGYAVDGIGNIAGLNLYKAKLVDISFLKDFHHLTHLDLRNNQIADISPLKELKNLDRLLLNYNKITRLPIEMVEQGMEIKWEIDLSNGIFLSGNPLESPPIEIVKQGTKAVRNYYKKLEKESVHLLHAKLLIVGSGDVGKTTLMKKLKDNNFNVIPGTEPSTHGINIVPWQLTCRFKNSMTETVNINSWDFGG